MASNIAGFRRPAVIASIDDTDSPYTVPWGVEVVYADPTLGAITINVPVGATYGIGRRLYIKDVGGQAGVNNITLSRLDADLIDGATTFLITSNYGAVTLLADNDNWRVL